MTPAKFKLTDDQRQLRDECIRDVKVGLLGFPKMISAAMQLRNDRLYRETHDSWELFCRDEFDMTPQYCNRLIAAMELKESLPETLSGKITNESQAKALASVPKEFRSKVLSETAKSGPVTAASIKKQSETIVSKLGPIESGISSKPPIELDECGTPVPKDGIPYWNRRQEVQDILTQISRIKGVIEKAKADGDKMYGIVSNAVIAHLAQAYTHFSEAKPYAVCTQCMGSPSVQPQGGCTMCKGSGLICKFKWDTVSRKEIKEIRLKSNAQRK